MLGRCYKAELSKLVKSKGIFIALAIIIVMVIFVALLSGLMKDVTTGVGGEEVGIQDIPREMYDQVIANLENKLEYWENDNNTVWSRFVDTKGYYKAQLEILKFLRAHEEIDASDLIIPSNALLSFAGGSYSFMTLAINVVMQIAMFYGVIAISSILAGEYRDGTLKMQLLRANSRSQILTAKWLAVFTVSIGLLIIGTIVSAIYAAFRYKFGAKDVLCVIANKDVFVLNENVFVLLAFIFSIIAIFAMIQFAVFMCSISRFNRGGSMAIPIIVLLFGNLSVYLLQVVYLGIIDFASNINLLSFMTANAMGIPGMSLYTAIPVIIVYMAAFMTTSYLTFNKREM